MKLISLIVALIGPCLASVSAQAPGGDAAAQLKALEAGFKAQLAEADQPLADLEANYLKALERLGKKRQLVSDFDGMMTVKKEIERIESGDSPPGETGGDPEVANLRATLERERTRIGQSLQNGRRKVYKNYEAELEKLKVLLTTEGDIEGALAARAAAEKIREIIDAGFGDREAVPASMPKVLWSLTDGGRYDTHSELAVEETIDGVVLRMEGTRGERFLTARKTFKPPYRIRAEVRTDSTNIRFKFGPKGRVIFNWEVKPAELRIHGYDTGAITPVRGEGLLEVDRFHDIEIDVTASGIVVKADGKKRGEISAESSLTEGSFRAGPAFGSVITFKKLEVIELEEN